MNTAEDLVWSAFILISLGVSRCTPCMSMASEGAGFATEAGPEVKKFDGFTIAMVFRSPVVGDEAAIASDLLSFPDAEDEDGGDVKKVRLDPGVVTLVDRLTSDG